MSKLLDEAIEKYESWLKIKPPIAPPKDRYTYEEAVRSCGMMERTMRMAI